MTQKINDSGIASLSGFSYQIRVFIYYLAEIEPLKQIEFETLDDVVENKESVEIDFFDKKFEYMNTFESSKDELRAIQVKRTSLTRANLNKVLLNWILLENLKDIKEYILFTESSYENKDNLFNIDTKKLFNDIKNSSQKKNSLKTKVKDLKYTLTEFEEKINIIRNKYTFINLQDIDNEIYKKFEIIFRKNAISNTKYILRVKSLIEIINADIMESIFKNNSFVCNHSKLMKYIEDICTKINSDKCEPQSFSSFKKSCFIDLSNESIIKSREYKQLKFCKNEKDFISRHLIFKQYYQSYRDSLLLDNQEDLTMDIENRTYNNFCDARDDLSENEDTPYKRLSKTKKKDNEYCFNTDLKHGSCIYLTKDNIEENIKISWKVENFE